MGSVVAQLIFNEQINKLGVLMSVTEILLKYVRKLNLTFLHLCSSAVLKRISQSQLRIQLSNPLLMKGNVSNLLLKYGIIYQSVGFLSVFHSAASCIVSFHQISRYFRDFAFSGSNPVNIKLLVNKKLLKDDS